MNRERLDEIFENTESNWKGDNAWQGLKILSKYTDHLIQAAEHDVIYSEDVDLILESGITEEDCIALATLNWIIEVDSFACYV